MKNNKTTKIYSILLLISIFITGLSNGFTFASEIQQSNSTEIFDSKGITGKEIFKTMDHTNYVFFSSPYKKILCYLRGDTYLFRELKDIFKNVKFSSYEEFKKLFNEKFEEITKENVESAKSNYAPIYVAKYDFGGLSGGLVTPYHWFKVFLPCVKNIYFDKFNYNNNDKNQCLNETKVYINDICFSLNPKDDTAIVLEVSQNAGRDEEIIIPSFLKYNGKIYRVMDYSKHE